MNAQHDPVFVLQRRDMIDRQLRRREIVDSQVLQAMQEIPREAFVPPEERSAAYDDRALPLSHGQTISQPYTVAFMCQELRLRGDEKILEIGTGSGYGAAVLSRLAREVHTIERIPALAELATARLARLGYDNVTVHTGDGTVGLPQEAPFDGIVVTAGGLHLPEPYRQQLNDGGRIVIPLQNASGGQTMWRFTRRGPAWVEEELGSFAFVPLVGELGWTDR